MNFRPELAAKVMAGEKTVTRRVVSRNPRSPWFIDGCSLKVGRDYAVCPGRGKPAIGRVRVLSVDRRHLGQITSSDARAEGFADRGEFRQAWKDINGGTFSDGTLVWRVEFEVVRDGYECVAVSAGAITVSCWAPLDSDWRPAWGLEPDALHVVITHGDECLSCLEDSHDLCPRSARDCGHHCNHSWTHDRCDWCERTWGEQAA